MPMSFVGVAAPDHKGRDAVPLPAPATLRQTHVPEVARCAWGSGLGVWRSPVLTFTFFFAGTDQ